VLCFLDLDNFKSVNDTCGHAAGDAILQAVAQVFRQRTRAMDTIGRVGGDEFALLLNGCQLSDAVHHVSSLRDRINGLCLDWGDQSFQVGLSAGITRLTPHTLSAEEAMAEADIACFAAKSAGRSKTRVYEARLRRDGLALSADAEIANRLREALDSDAIALNAQPLQPMRADQGSEGASEILIRLSDRRGRLIPPNVLLPIAARFGLAQALDRWVLRRVLTWLSGRADDPWPARLYVNITSSSLVDESFTHFLQAELPNKSMARRLGIEIAEASVVLHAEAACRKICQINAMGCGVSIDQITGRADSIALLSSLPVSLLKLSPDFSAMAAENDLTYIQAQALVRVAHKLSLPLAVTGIETRDTLACVKRLGAEFGQGVAIAPAAPLILPSDQDAGQARTNPAADPGDKQGIA
jgi:diguanylate cyclase (GGDEF)-like protein